jgi:hypothetical protein
LEHAVLGVPIPVETGRVFWDPLSCQLLVSEELVGEFPLNLEGIPPGIEGNNRLLGLGGHTAIVEYHFNAVLWPL